MCFYHQFVCVISPWKPFRQKKFSYSGPLSCGYGRLLLLVMNVEAGSHGLQVFVKRQSQWQLMLHELYGCLAISFWQNPFLALRMPWLVTNLCKVWLHADLL